MSEFSFDGRVAVVTGAGRGLGRTHALLLAQRGAKVVVNDLGAEVDGASSSEEPANEVVAEIEAAGGTAVANFDDVASYKGSGRLVQQALDTFGGLDVVVANAGTNETLPMAELSLEKFDRMWGVHLNGTF